MKKENTNKCDLYSIGIILYLLKTGECIFEGKKKFDILANKNSNKIKKETDDVLLNKLIKKLVVIDPHERMEWNDYFNDPFFRENDENEIKLNEKKEKEIKEEFENKIKTLENKLKEKENEIKVKENEIKEKEKKKKK